MKKNQFSETQIVLILKEAKAGMKVADIDRKHGISAATYYSRKSKYASMETSGLKHMKELESELSQFKCVYTELARYNDAVKALIAKCSEAA